MLHPSASTLTLIALAFPGVITAQVNPPTVIQGTAPTGDVHSMTNNQNSAATLGNGDVAAVVYRQTSDTKGGHLALAVTKDPLTWTDYYPLPNNFWHRAHEWNSGVMCASRDCDILHVGWADLVLNSSYLCAYYQDFNATTRKWIGTPTRIATADHTKKQGVFTRDIAVTNRGTLAIAVGVGPNGGQGMGPWDCGLLIKKAGAKSFSKLYPMRNGGYPESREASIVVIEEIVHCAFKSSKGAGGMAYRSFDTTTMTWQQSTQVMVGPNHNGINGVDGINAGNKGMITADTMGGLYIMYLSGSNGGVVANNKMRMAYAKNGTGSKNSDWKDCGILDHNLTLGKNPRGVTNPDPAYPILQGGDTDYYYYTVAPGIQDAVFVFYSKPWEDFQHKYMQIWLHGVNQKWFGGQEIQFWNDTAPLVFERLGALRNTSSLGHAVWLSYGKTDAPINGLAPNGIVRLWAVTTNLGRTASFGTGCSGANGQVPRMRANSTNLPQLGNRYQIDIDRMPSQAMFTLLLGFQCQKLNLGFMGAGACDLHTDYPVVYPLQASANGDFSLQWPIPNDPTLIGLHLLSQSVVFDYSAPGNVTVTNALRTIIWN